MNLKVELNEKEIKLLEKAGIYIENRDYDKDEMKRYAFNIQEYIISHSSKNGDINKISLQYNQILDTLLN